MIKSIIADQIATFTGSPQILSGLSKLNFVYGCNGTGKTTLSRIIYGTPFADRCHVAWYSTPLQTFVYNRDFVLRNLSQSSQIKGIFTLGETTSELLQKVEETKTQLASVQQQLEQKRRTLSGESGVGGKLQERRSLQTAFAEDCWTAKKSYDSRFKVAFEGLRGDKTKFRDRLLAERTRNSAEQRNLEYLQERAASVFAVTDGVEETIRKPQFEIFETLETAPVANKVIVGRTDVDIAAMIRKLNNSDWVQAGTSYFNSNGNRCPFCQQTAPETLRADLAAYFDETFTKDLDDLNALVVDYTAAATLIHQHISMIAARTSSRIDSDAIKSILKDLDVNWRKNLNSLKQKQQEPSQRTTLESSIGLLSSLDQLFDQNNANIERHNSLIRNRDTEQGKLISEIWRFLLDTGLKPALDRYELQDRNLSAAIGSLQSQIATLERSQREVENELRALEQQITSVEPTVQYMNEYLTSCGFTGFRLQTTQQNGFYRLIRDDGSPVEDSLSEGERSFVAFLYFFHLLNGSESEHGVVGDRVVVIDDPVSSLDSNVLFAVSSLIRGLYDPVSRGASAIKQLIVLTHNVYFHKEITCHPPRGVRFDFWVVKKRHGVSTIEAKQSNPVSSSYDLLWEELQDSTLSPVTIQNTMRRILENYFRMTGNTDISHLEGSFTGHDRQLLRSLFSWSNAGSHDVIEDLYASNDDWTIEHFQSIFKRVFDCTSHSAHYEMMMNRNR